MHERQQYMLCDVVGGYRDKQQYGITGDRRQQGVDSSKFI
jgi:hypothetical protein